MMPYTDPDRQRAWQREYMRARRAADPTITERSKAQMRARYAADPAVRARQLAKAAERRQGKAAEAAEADSVPEVAPERRQRADRAPEVRPRTWMDDALCAQIDVEAFFPEKGGSTKSAKAICALCDVRAECLTYALANDERYGIWGGLTERERRKLARKA